MKLHSHLSILLVGLFCLGCQAPHDNPYDPESSRYNPPLSDPDVSVRVRSIHVSRSFPTTDTYIINAELSGPDAETLDSAWVAYKTFAAETLSWDSSTGVWATNFAIPYHDASSVQSFIGHPFTFTARSSAGSYTFGPAYLFRAIVDVPQLTSPAADDTVDSQPTFVWPVFEAGAAFESFTYLVTVINDSGDTLWNQAFSSSVLSARITSELPNRLYQWTLTVIDEFANSSRSKEREFRVIAGSEEIRSRSVSFAETTP
jgi:hypothetical protein